VLLSLRSDSLGPVSTVSLVENGELVNMASSNFAGPFQPHQALPSLPLLAPVTSYLASLQHSSSSAVQGLARLRWKEVSEGYATSRGHWGYECIARSAEFIDDMDTGNGLGGSAEGEMRSAKIHAIVEMGRALVVIAEVRDWPHCESIKTIPPDRNFFAQGNVAFRNCVRLTSYGSGGCSGLGQCYDRKRHQ
jgi:hypothetical protein